MTQAYKKSRSPRGTGYIALCLLGSLGLLVGSSHALARSPAASGGQESGHPATTKQGERASQGQATSSGQQGKQSAQGQPANREGSPVKANVTVSGQELLNAGSNKNDWLLYGRTYDNQRFSPLAQVNASNVRHLVPAAIIQTGIANAFEDNPIEVNGVLYVVTPHDHVIAYNATTGQEIWSFSPQINYSALCCGPVSRGVAVAYGKVFLATLDARVIALDAKTGKEEWQASPAANFANSTDYSFTMAPQVYDGMVIVGSSGGEYPTRGFVAAYDANSGKQDWIFRTTAAPGEPGGNSWGGGDGWKTGGAPVWNTPAVDTRDKLILFATGNPNPNYWGKDRKGDDDYTCSIVAIHAKDGKLAWWYQEVHHDLWDYDATGPVVLLDAMDHGQRVPAAAEAGKEGQVFIVNRTNGKLIRESEPFVMQSKTMWTVPSSKPVTIYPGAQGGNEWSPEAYSPLTHYFYVQGTNEAWDYTGKPLQSQVASNGPNVPQIGERLGSSFSPVISKHPNNTIPPTGDLSAVDVDTGKIAWQYKSSLPMLGGVLATAGNLVFAGEQTGYFDAFDAKTGDKLWHFYLGAGVTAPPITYRVNGVQYIAVAAGGNPDNGNPILMKEVGRPQYGDTIAIFALPRG